jgi:hypothetical protein
MPTAAMPSGSSDAILSALERAQQAGQCDNALAELRAFRPTDEGVSALIAHAQDHPGNAGCQANAIAARMMYNAQLKAYLDQELEADAQDAIDRFPDTPEAEMLKHAMAVLSTYASEDELTAAQRFFGEIAQADRAEERFPHFKLLQVIASQQLIERRAFRSEAFADAVKPLKAEVDQLSHGRQASVILRRVRARMGA